MRRYRVAEISRFSGKSWVPARRFSTTPAQFWTKRGAIACARVAAHMSDREARYEVVDMRNGRVVFTAEVNTDA